MAVELPKLYLGADWHAPLFAILGAEGFIANLIILFYGGDHFETQAMHKLVSQISVGAWVIGPPLWFFYEYFFYFPRHGNPRAGYERLKAAQEVTSRLWFAGSVFLGALYSTLFSAAAGSP